MAGIRTDAQQWQWRWVQKKHLFQATGSGNQKKTLISKACIYQNEMAQNPGVRHLEKENWSNSLHDSHGPANTKYTFDCKLRSE